MYTVLIYRLSGNDMIQRDVNIQSTVLGLCMYVLQYSDASYLATCALLEAPHGSHVVAIREHGYITITCGVDSGVLGREAVGRRELNQFI